MVKKQKHLRIKTNKLYFVKLKILFSQELTLKKLNLENKEN